MAKIKKTDEEGVLWRLAFILFANDTTNATKSPTEPPHTRQKSNTISAEISQANPHDQVLVKNTELQTHTGGALTVCIKNDNTTHFRS